jgi:hypothetical protein
MHGGHSGMAWRCSVLIAAWVQDCAMQHWMSAWHCYVELWRMRLQGL